MDQCIFSDLCRLCLVKNDKFFNIFSEEGDHLQIKEKLTSLFPFPITENESMATTICFTCYDIVDNFYPFYTRVISNQSYFNNTLEDIQFLKDDHFHASVPEETEDDQNPKLMFSIGPTSASDDCLMKYEEALDCFVKGDLATINHNAYQIDTNLKYQITCNVNPINNEHAGESSILPPPSVNNVIEAYEGEGDKIECTPNTEGIIAEPPLIKKKTRKKKGRKKKGELLKTGIEPIIAPKQHVDMLPEHLKTRMTKAKGDAQIKEFVNLICDICKTNHQYRTFKDLQEHFLAKHHMRGYVVCCEKKLFRKDRLMNHITNHINPEAFKCPDCGQNRKSKILLRIHMKQHLPPDERKYQCDKCAQRFVLKSQLTNHEATHFTEEQKRFVCEICGKAFALKFVMIKHKLTHSKERNFVCEICAKSFSSKSNLQSHMTHHSDAYTPRVQCSYCNLWYKNLDTLRTHMHRHRDNRQHICPTCSKECTTRSSLAAHIRYVHLKVREFECNICNKQFRRRLELTEHMARHTGEVLYKCPFCPKTFNSSSNYFSHRKNRHPSLFAGVCKDNKLLNAEPPVLE